MTKSISANELETLSEWLKIEENKILFNQYVKINYAVDSAMSSFSKEKAKLMLLTHIPPKKETKRKTIKLYKYVAVASIILLFVVPFTIKKTPFNKVNIVAKTPENNIFIGSDKAILTLENGEQITLKKGDKFINKNVNSNGKTLIYNKKRKQTAQKEVQYNYLTIPRGGEFFVELSDGTKVWLNSETKLKYPVAFAQGETRTVELLYGEAYFKVTSSKKHNGAKFSVKTKVQDIKVLGTEFNIQSYKEDETIATTLIEGKVAVSNGISNVILQPGEQSNTNMKADNITIKTVDINSVTAWKNGYFHFKNESLQTIMKRLSRWYNFEVSFANSTKKQLVFSGNLKRNKNIETLLNKIEKAGNVTFDITNQAILVK